MSRWSIRGRTKTSLTKLLNREGVECKKRQKDADGHSGITRVPYLLQASSFLTERTIKDTGGQIQLISQLQNLGKRVYFATARRSKFGVKPGTPGIIVRCKSVDGMRALFYIDILKNYWIQRPIVLVDKSAEKISSLINRTWNPLRVKNNVFG